MDIPKFDEIFNQMNTNLRISGIKFDNSPLGLRFYIPYFVVVLIVLEEIYFFISKVSSENFLTLTALAPCIGIGIQTVAKILFIASKKHKIFELMHSLRQLYQEILDDPGKKSLVAKEVVLLKSLTKYYFILNWALISFYNFSSLLYMLYNYIKTGEVIFSLPFSVLVPFSTNSWHAWILMYAHAVFCGCISILYYTTVDALYFNLSFHVCNSFTVISNDVKHLNANANVQELSEIIKKHQYTLKLSDDLEDIFKLPNFFNMFVGSVEICALGFNVMAGDLSQLPIFILFLFSQLLQILVMSIFGENLIRESTKVGDAAFLCEWYNMDKNSKKYILTIMQRCQRPQRLTAYNFSIISYQSFTKIISTSWSYFTILRTMYKPETDSIDHSN